MTPTTTPSTARASRSAPAKVSPEQVTALQGVRGAPCVSVLMSTTPAVRMTPDDLVRLRSLVQDVRRRLAQEERPLDHEQLLERLEDLVVEASVRPTLAGLALYASASTGQRVVLPLSVVERTVVDPTFATRDLVRALHRVPRHTVLVLSAGEARLFEETGAALLPASAGTFPLVAEPAHTSHEHRPAGREAAMRAFLRTVDRALGKHLALHPAPLVLIGPKPLVAAFTSRSRNVARLAGTITGSRASAPLGRLRALVRPVVDGYLHSRRDEALELLGRRMAEDRVVTGMPAAWLAAQHERPEVLVVEDGLVYPARLSAEGDLLTPAEDVEHPEVIDDAVDELIEVVLRRGGWVALVDDGSLGESEGVALAVRRHD